MGQMLSKHVSGHRSTCTVLTLTYWCPSTPNPISFLSRNAGPSVSFTNSQMSALTMSATNLKWYINFYCNPISLPVSIFDNLARLIHPYFPFPILMATAHTLVSLLYSWWKPQCWLKKAPYIHWAISAPAMSTDVSHVGVTLFPSF